MRTVRCDNCDMLAEDTEAILRFWGVIRYRGGELDLCPSCMDRLIETIGEMGTDGEEA